MNDDKKLNPENEPLENAEEVATATTNNSSNNVGKEDSLATFTNEYKKRRAEIKNEIKTLKAEYKEAISQEISNETKERNDGKRKSIVFVTGVPGAGKTLVGLHLSVDLQNEGASMLSGNGPLVNVLRTALRRDYQKYKKLVSL